MGEQAEQKVIVLPLSPPRRLAPGARYRSLKTIADREVWKSAWQRVEALTGEGWTLERVEVDWGRTLPLTPSEAGNWIRQLLEGVAPQAPEVSWTWSGRGRGETRAYLVKHG